MVLSRKITQLTLLYLYNDLPICVRLSPACGITAFLMFSQHLPRGLLRRETVTFMRDRLYAAPFRYFQLAQKLNIDSYHRLRVIAVPFMPWFFLRASCFKGEMKFRIRILLYLFDCGSFRQDHGKSKFTIYIFLYNVSILY